MKKSILYITAVALALSAGFYGCKKDKDPELDASPKSLNFTHAGESKTFNVTSDVNWTISGNHDWLTISDASGKGDKAVTVTATANAGAARTATLTIAAKGAKDVPISVTQEAAPPIPVITINGHPAATTTVTAGSITGSLSVEATVTENATPGYQWYRSLNQNNTGGATLGAAGGAQTKTLTIPTTLDAGTYYYYCVVSASGGAEPKTSTVATVTVLSAGGAGAETMIMKRAKSTRSPPSQTYPITALPSGSMAIYFT